jgi:signal transduction histidine kinase
MTDLSRQVPPAAATAGVELERVLEEIPAAVSVTRGPEHRIEYLNRFARGLIGGREVVGRTIRDAWPELEGQGWLERMDQVYATGEPYHAPEARVRFDRDGDGVPEEGFFSFTWQPLRDGDGRVSGILRLAVEVTEAVRARAALDEARAEAQAHARRSAELAAEIQAQATELQEQAAELQQQLAEAQAMGEELESTNLELLDAQQRAESALGEEAAIVETLHRVGTSLAAELDLQKIVQIATDETTRITGAQFGAFFYNVLNEAGESYTLYTLSGVPREAFSRFPMPRNTAVFAPTFHGEGVVRSDDITADPRYGHSAPHHGMPKGHLPVRSYLAVPVLSRTGEVLGGLFYGHAETGVFTERSERIASGVAGWAGLAIDNARLHERESRARLASERGAERLRRLLEVADALSRSASAAEVAEVVVAKGMEETGADAASLALLSDDGTEFHTLATRGYPEVSGERFRSYPVQPGRPLSDLVIGRDTALLVESFEAWQARYPESVDTIRETGFPAFAAVPILAQGTPVGAMAFSFREARGFDAGVPTFLRALAGHCATALERARLYEEERAARAEAEAANLAKSQFLANMSHELRTPLNAIGGYTELLEMGLRGPVNPEQHTDLERIRRAQQHLLGLINDVLNFAKLEAGRIEFDVRPIELEEVLANVEALTSPQARAAGLTCLRVDGCRPAHALADPDKLEQVLLNLISNAIKFTGTGGRVELECQSGGGMVRIVVRDTGVGIAPDRLADIFDPFVQVDPDLTRQRQGAGLGLAISRELARAMGGEITVESRPGEGSTFTLTLPAA